MNAYDLDETNVNPIDKLKVKILPSHSLFMSRASQRCCIIQFHLIGNRSKLSIQDSFSMSQNSYNYYGKNNGINKELLPHFPHIYV